MVIEKINREYIKSDEQQLDEFFTAAAVKVNAKGEATHAGIIIHCEEGYWLCHFGGGDVELEILPNDEWYFHKAFSFILPVFCGQFLGHCRKISQNTLPRYGYFYPGSYYIDGVYFNEQMLPEYMTCVGFCINVIKGFVEADEYFQYTDWVIETDEYKNYIQSFIKKLLLSNPDLDPTLIADNIRRITPPEYLASAYLTALPIRKASVDEIIEPVKDVIRARRNP